MKRNSPKPTTVTGIVRRYEALRLLLSVALGMLLCIVLIFFVTDQPMKAIKYLMVGPFTRYNRTAEVVEKMQPMLLAGCSFQLMLTVGNFSMINESCVMMAPCLICTPVILNEALFGRIPGEPGKILWLTVCCIASAAVGGTVSLIPPFLKRAFGCNEIVTSSLLNAVFSYFVEWYVKHILYDETSGLSASKPYPENVKPTNLIYGSRVSTMILVGLAFCFLTYLLIYHTKLGYEARIVGANPSFAFASGIDVRRTTLLVSVIAGGVAGIMGTYQTLSYNQRFSGYAANISDGMFCGIFAKENPLLIPVAALGLGYLRVTAETMSNNTDVPTELITVMTSLIIMMLAADQMLNRYRDRAIKKYCSFTPEDRESLR